VSAPRVLLSGLVLGQPMGGVRRHNAELLPRAARLLARAGGGLEVVLARRGTPIELAPPVETTRSWAPSGPPLVRAWAEPRVLRGRLAAARGRGLAFDLVHTAHLPAPGGLPVPYTLTLHDLRALELRELSSLRRRLGPRLIAAAVRGAAAVITVSEHVRALVEERFAPRRTFVVPNAGDHLPVLPRAPGPDAELLAVGHLEPRKNLGLLLRALAFDPELPPLALAGAAHGDERKRLERLAAELGVARRVRFLGSVPDETLPQLYARCAAVVLPSRLEGFGIGVLEALRAEAPLAISDLQVLREVAGQDVPTFAPDDPAGCAGAIRTALAQSAATLAALASHARRFAWQRSAEALVEAWSSVAAAP
jgi:glycosyltransferase involved in cell wall biosynthesis